MTPPTLGLFGLRRARLYRRWLAAGVLVEGWDADSGYRTAAEAAGVRVRPSAAALAQGLPAPRVVWLDVAPGRTTELALQDVWPELARGELIVDGGDGDWRDARRREAALAAAGVHFADAFDDGEQLHIGGSDAALAALHPLLVLRGGWRHCGAAGAAHFVRMVHAGVALAAHAAQAEAEALLAAAPRILGAHVTLPRVPAAPRPSPALAHGVLHAAHAAGVAAPMLSLALALAAEPVRAATRDEDGPS